MPTIPRMERVTEGPHSKWHRVYPATQGDKACAAGGELVKPAWGTGERRGRSASVFAKQREAGWHPGGGQNGKENNNTCLYRCQDLVVKRAWCQVRVTVGKSLGEIVVLNTCGTY